MIAHCRQNLADYKVPRDVYIVERIPLTASGKVHKVRLKELADRGDD